MTPLTEWLKPPRTLLLILFLLALVSVSALGWFGWKLFEQERIVETQRSQDGLEQAADRIAATLRGALAETGERLGSWETGTLSGSLPQEGLLLLFKDGKLSATPAGQIFYYPAASPEPEAGSAVFAAVELLEFAQGRPAGALQSYERLASSNNAAIRAGALLRTARVLRNSGRKEESRAVYARLAASAGVRVAGAPAELVARHALCELSGQRADAEALRNDLLRGRWHLSRGQFEFYWSEAARLSGTHEQPPPDALALSEAAAQAWNERKIGSGSRGQHTVWIGRPAFLSNVAGRSGQACGAGRRSLDSF